MDGVNGRGGVSLTLDGRNMVFDFIFRVTAGAVCTIYMYARTTGEGVEGGNVSPAHLTPYPTLPLP